MADRAWTRDDLPGVHWPGIHGEPERQGAEKALDAVVEHLNEHHPKPPFAEEGIRMIHERDELRTRVNTLECDRDRWRRAHEIAKRELDQAREQWKKWEYKADEWQARAEAAEARTTPAVTKADIEQAVAEWVDDAPEIVNEVWSLVSGDDPAVFVVRESDVAAVEAVTQMKPAPAVTRDEVWRVVAAHDPGDDEMAICRVNRLTDAVCDLLGVEAEPADPIEDKARELHEVAQGDGPFIVWEALTDPERTRFCRMAAHVLGQEATR